MEELRIKALLSTAEILLRSDSPFAETLEANIDACFYGHYLHENEKRPGAKARQDYRIDVEVFLDQLTEDLRGKFEGRDKK